MRTVKALLRLLLLPSLCVLIVSASAQQKYFRITDEGKYYFFNNATVEQNHFVKGANEYTRPISIRTFFLEAKKASLFPGNLPFDDFRKMTIAQQQHLLDSLQPDFDWSKYHVNIEPEASANEAESVSEADTIYSVQNLTFDKESSTLGGDLVTGAGRMQQFMVYPIAAKNSGNIRWFIEWVEPDLYLKKKGYRNMDLPEQVVYEALKAQGIDLRVLGSIAD